ncbi:hypothetical protein GCM10009718_29010 [Isoptericola halotolerans]|uniref:Excisionase family DNA binding protein n=1 Tax=Isoptericola halotolerans TaxID=300560 RepID=A0ABX2A774_9MICO|nr:helix-turn-helix domain-containing protein [Isoptericola halotolerans]NOV97758.1 excisionase family DNA binding protein [Isoptericola halotolerans]
MAARSVVAETYVPHESDSALADVRSFMAAHESKHGSAPNSRFLLVGDSEGDQVELPETLYLVLRQAVDAMAAGKAVTISLQEPQLTTQQAADLLGVSRPTVVRLVESGELSAERVGSRRRLALGDVLAYREKRRRRQYAMLEATSVDLDDEENPELMIERLREARKAVAGKRDA